MQKYHKELILYTNEFVVARSSPIVSITETDSEDEDTHYISADTAVDPSGRQELPSSNSIPMLSGEEHTNNQRHEMTNTMTQIPSPNEGLPRHTYTNIATLSTDQVPISEADLFAIRMQLDVEASLSTPMTSEMEMSEQYPSSTGQVPTREVDMQLDVEALLSMPMTSEMETSEQYPLSTGQVSTSEADLLLAIDEGLRRRMQTDLETVLEMPMIDVPDHEMEMFERQLQADPINPLITVRIIQVTEGFIVLVLTLDCLIVIRAESE